MYGKIFDTIYDGTLAGHWEAIVTFQQMIVLASADGVIDMTPEGIARRTTIPLRIIKKGIEFLEKPDPYTRTPGDDGKRIVLLDEHRPWGWRLVNHNKYKRLRDMEQKRAADRERIQRKRQGNKGVATKSPNVAGVANVAHADAYTDTTVNITVEEAQNSQRGTRLPPDWSPSEKLKAWAERERPDLDHEVVLAKFRDHWVAKPGRAGMKLDWDATYRNWIRDEKPGRVQAKIEIDL